MKKITTCLFISILTTIILFGQAKKGTPKKSQIELHFNHTVNKKPLTLIDSSYTNSYQEDFTITKFCYYISNITLYKQGKIIYTHKGYYLVTQAVDSSKKILFDAPINTYDSIAFIIGVDSAKNISGAQKGALDPLQAMFWTWNTGYIMQKIEGTSSKSNLINNKIEYHLGGFKHPYNIATPTVFKIPNQLLLIQASTTCIINFNVAIDKFWKGENPNSIAFVPICSTPGTLAIQLAQNFKGMFTCSNVTYLSKY
jgi:hypothetical protein